jgi:hypothetical protein
MPVGSPRLSDQSPKRPLIGIGGHLTVPPLPYHRVIRALENEQDDRAKVNGLFGSLNDWKG